MKLLFLSLYSLELNPAEKMEAQFKRTFTNRLYKPLDELSLFIDEVTKATLPDAIRSICSYKYMFEGHLD